MQCTKYPKLADDTSVPIRTTEHNTFVTPDCISLNLQPIMDLKCMDGTLYLVDPTEQTKMAADGTNFCFDPDDPLADAGEHTHQREVLKEFWKHLQVELESTLHGCPVEALECFNFDEFADLYTPGRLEDMDLSFLGLDLDSAASLEYNVYIDEYVREFFFAKGMKGHVIEFQNGMVYATINTEGEDDFTIFIRPCDRSEGETCKYVIYREKKIEGQMWEEEHLAADQGFTRTETEGFQLDMQGIIHERFTAHGIHPGDRRYLQDSTSVALTFMYDPAIQTFDDANAHSAEIILDFNDALGEHQDSGFRLLRRALVEVPENHFNNDHGSCCGNSIPECASESNIMQTCRDFANGLPPTHMAHLHHCFTHKNSFTGGTIGCGGKNNVGVTTLENGHTTNIAIHEIAHQLGAPHKSHCWCATRIVWCWKTECSIMNPSVTNTVRRFHIESIEAMQPAASDHGDTYLPFNPSAKLIPKIPDIVDTTDNRSRKVLGVTVISCIVVFIVLSLLFMRRRKQHADRRHRQELLESLISPESNEEFMLSQPKFTPLRSFQGSDFHLPRQSPLAADDDNDGPPKPRMGSFSSRSQNLTIQQQNYLGRNQQNTQPIVDDDITQSAILNIEAFHNDEEDTFESISTSEALIEPFANVVTRSYARPRIGSFTHDISWDDLEREHDRSLTEEGALDEADRKAWWRFGKPDRQSE